MPCNKPDLVKREAVGRMTEEGYTAREISDRLGITKRTVLRHRQSLGIAQERAPLLTVEERARINEMLDDEVPLAEIARTIGRSPDHLWKRYKGMSRGGPMPDAIKLRKQLGLLLT